MNFNEAKRQLVTSLFDSAVIEGECVMSVSDEGISIEAPIGPNGTEVDVPFDLLSTISVEQREIDDIVDDVLSRLFN